MTLVEIHLSCFHLFCASPISIDLHINQAQMSQVSLGRPEFVPGTPPGHPDRQIPLCDFSLPVFFLSIMTRLCRGTLANILTGNDLGDFSRFLQRNCPKRGRTRRTEQPAPDLSIFKSVQAERSSESEAHSWQQRKLAH